MQKQNGFIAQGPITVKSHLDGFISVTKKLRDAHGKKGGNNRVYDSTNKIYISIQGTRITTKNPNPHPVIAFNLGMEICKKARFLMGDYIEIFYNKNNKTFFFRRTKQTLDGYKLGPCGGGRVNRSPNTAVVKMAFKKEFFPNIQELSELKNISFNQDGVFAVYDGSV